METKELTPEYVLQPHAISRAAYKLSSMARKIIVMSMAIIPPDLSTLTATFSLFEFLQALGLEAGGKQYKIIQEAIKECVSALITIETAEEWRVFTWIHTAKIDKKTNMITLELSKELSEYILEIKKMYTCINLTDFGKLQGFYTIRYFELAKSYESLAGKNGNRQNCWYFERTVENLRKILGIEEGTYLITNDFRKKVIENPVKELNESNLGLNITLEYIRRGRFLVAVRFICKKAPIKLENRKKKGDQVGIAPPESPIEDRSLAEKELEHIKILYPEEYAERYARVLAAPPNGFMRDTPRLWAGQADRIACYELLEQHGIRK